MAWHAGRRTERSVDYQTYVAEAPDRLSATAEPEAIARFCEAVADRHADHRAGVGATAPPTFAFCLAMAHGAFPFPTDGLIHAEQAFTFERPLRAGEPLALERALTRARQRGEGAGALWLLTWEASATAADGGKVFAMTSRLVARPGGGDAAAVRSADAPGGLPARPVFYGHVAEGNVHLNAVLGASADAAVEAALDEVVYQSVVARDGTISAEHGIGQLKRGHLHTMRSPAELAFMASLKALCDPSGILNPGKVL
jgi:FAD/FMN-containing dehydrogenase